MEKGREESEQRIQNGTDMTAGYLIVWLCFGVALFSVWVMLQELGNVCHNGFLIWFVYVNI